VTNPYRSVLRTPGALRFALAGFVGRFPMSMMIIGTLLVVRHATGSYGIAGAASASASLAMAVSNPPIGRLVDRRGQTAVVPWLLALFVAGTALLVVSAAVKAPTPLLFIGAIVAGVGQLPYTSLVRARWTYLLAESPQLPTAFALEAAADELVFVVGPVLVTALAVVTPLLGPVVAAALAIIGTIPFLAARSSEPVPTPSSGSQAAWRVPGLWVLVAVSSMLGFTFGGFDVDLVAFATHHGAAAIAGLLLGLVAFGSMLAGLWYGARRWRLDLAVRLRVSLMTLAVGALPTIAAANMWQMAPAALLVGLSIAPSLIAASGLVQRVVPADCLTEGFVWQTTGINIGVAGGTALAGLLVDTVGVRWALVAGPVAMSVATLVAFAFVHLLRAPQPAGNAERTTAPVPSGQTA
jgi:MFS family permease